MSYVITSVKMKVCFLWICAALFKKHFFQLCVYISFPFVIILYCPSLYRSVTIMVWWPLCSAWDSCPQSSPKLMASWPTSETRSLMLAYTIHLDPTHHNWGFSKLKETYFICGVNLVPWPFIIILYTWITCRLKSTWNTCISVELLCL